MEQLQTINWDQVNTVLTGGEVDANQRSSSLDLAKQWYINRMTDDQLTSLMESLDWYPSEDDLSDEDRLQAFKVEISSGRGSDITCIEPTANEDTGDEVTGYRIQLDGTNLIEFGQGDLNDSGELDWPGCSEQEDGSLTFGPDNIISEEYDEWSSQLLFMGDTLSEEQDESDIDQDGSVIQEGDGGVTAGLFGVELLPPNRNFEECVNNLLNEFENSSDTELIEDIYGMEDITELEDEHIQFIARKLEMMLTSRARLSIKNCITQHIDLDSDICSTSLSHKMVVILNILFSVIGFNLNFHDVSNTDVEYRDALIHIIEQLGPLIPRAIRKIIDISEEIELDTCQQITNRTSILRELYNNLFGSSSTSVEFNMGLSDLLSESTTSSVEFNRATIMAILGMAFLKFI